MPGTFTVDLTGRTRLTQSVRWPLHLLLAAALAAGGCASKPAAAGFESVPAPSATTARLPQNATTSETQSPAAPTAAAKASGSSRPKASGARNSPISTLIVTPMPVLTGRVTSYNAPGRFVVLNFPVGHLPQLEQRLDVYRQGIKVGEVKVTGPQRDDHIVADVTQGEVEAGDEVRGR